MIAWFVRNPVAANILMVLIMVLGTYSALKRIPLEVFPEFELDIVNITVAYPGATPREVEDGIITRVEEAIADLQGITEILSDASEGSAQLRVEIDKQHDVTELVNQIKTRVDGITNRLPADAERPVVEQLTRRREVISVILGSNVLSETELRLQAEAVRDEMLRLPGITQADLGGVRPFEISISVPQATLRQYGITLDTIAQAIRNASRDIPGGTVKTSGGDILVRSLGQAYKQAEFANITVISGTDGSRIRLGDIANINDGFNEDELYSEYDGQKAAFINVYRIGDQNAITLANTIKDYIAQRRDSLPAGTTLDYWRDNSKTIKARLSTLTSSAIQSAILVFIVLTLFLRVDLAFWIMLGIPISFLGALWLMPELGVTLNLVSMFAFILVLGIVVDDAIVTGENIYSHVKRHDDPMRAAVEGTQEITVPVTFGVMTTVAAFTPLLMMAGDRGPIFAQIPLIVIPVLLFSLIESKLILPVHLRHLHTRRADEIGAFTRFQRKFSHGLETFIERVYRPSLNTALNWRYLVISVFIALFILSLTLPMSGRMKFTFFPRVQGEFATGTLQMQEGTPIEVTTRNVERMANAAQQLQEKYIEPTTGASIIQHILVTVGATGSSGRRGESAGKSHLASVTFEITAPEERSLDISSTALTNEWRKLIGPIPGAQEVSFRAEVAQGGSPLAVQLRGNNFEDMAKVADKIKAKMAEYEGVFDIKNSFEGGKQEVQLRIRPEAEQLGLTLGTVGTQVRHAIFGAEAQRIQRDQSEVKVMVRYPKEERYSLSDLQNLLIRSADGAEIPLSEVADITLGQGAPKISRVNRQRVIDITADVDKGRINIPKVVADLKAWMPEALADYPSVSYDMEGEQKEQKESMGSLMMGLGFALMAIYILLAIPLQSYTQPLVVMSVIPFSIIGALGGHLLMGMDLSISSMFGLLALFGVAVNDALVMVDRINQKLKEGLAVADAVREAGVARFRPILLTSLTTFAGMTPLILDKTTQAQFLIPMAVTLGFGILFATFLALYLVPALYLMGGDVRELPAKLFGKSHKIANTSAKDSMV
ncbi:efflux RND transporter permease subunit [Thiothrix subterranea]|uniref:Efflux RND transporter permease subunit n=1 Tax=Thiothrix subterranea TaxID=2735563 RepID=A0AA51R6G0_9GAMM|nr:efflux RND transporter permease subunit [Thiothrix subterranea]MDQ5767458.1 efflux RND transporter permease subunit [Thiothrix subterranea]WML88671.1 efflux RND transporter permease subunit [Thiothrix subterranea]